MKPKKLRLAPVFALALILLITVSCGKSASPSSGSPDESVTEAEIDTTAIETTVTPETTAAQTKAPETTEEVTTYEPIDPTLPYYEQCDIQFSRFGFSDGQSVCGADEAAALSKVNKSNVKTEKVDLTGVSVPFTQAIRITTPNTTTNFWDSNIGITFTKDLKIEVGDIIAGCFWIRDLSDPDPANAYIAIKTPTDNWASEGKMNINTLILTDEWQQVFFYGEVINEEPNSNKLVFQLFTGPTPNAIEFGGLYMKVYPGDQYDATFEMP
jgi:hypothetical protein